MESASWQRPLYGFKISQNQAEMPLKSGFSDGLGGLFLLSCNVFLSVLDVDASARRCHPLALQVVNGTVIGGFVE